MNIDRLVLTIAGSFILLSVLLSVFHSPYWLFFTAFVGANLLQASFTGFCPLAIMLKKGGSHRIGGRGKRQCCCFKHMLLIF
jgi:hypothetical protein